MDRALPGHHLNIGVFHAVVIGVTVEDSLAHPAHHALGPTEQVQEGLPEVANEPVDGEVDGGVEYLKQLHRGHRVHVPEGGWCTGQIKNNIRKSD